jgi:hypothetical protein
VAKSSASWSVAAQEGRDLARLSEVEGRVSGAAVGCGTLVGAVVLVVGIPFGALLERHSGLEGSSGTLRGSDGGWVDLLAPFTGAGTGYALKGWPFSVGSSTSIAFGLS